MLHLYYYWCRYVFILVCIGYLLIFLIKTDKLPFYRGKVDISDLWHTSVDYSRPDDTSCYKETWEGYEIEHIREKVVLHNSIFFHDTSCGRNLPLRQACAVESAARLHPERQVFVLFMKLVSVQERAQGPLDEIYNLDNVDFARVDLNYYTLGTPLEQVIENYTSYHGRRHHRRIAEYLKFLTLYRYGGMVVDLDMIVAPINGALFPSWVVMEDDKRLGSAVISIPKDELADQLTFQFLSALANTTTLDEVDGGQIMYEVLKRDCNTSDVSQMTYSKCGVHVYNSSIFYDVNLNASSKRQYARYAGFRIRNSDNFSSTIHEDSLFADLAQKYCPSLYHRSMYTHRNNA